jgi:tetratricopeptide (TPR) repeat protein
MFWFFKKRHSNENSNDAGIKAEERFSRLKKCRFKSEAGDNYSVELHRHRLVMELFKKNLFAWCSSSFFSVTDFTAEADFSFDTKDSYSSCGIIFRKGSEFNYYYFLVSNRGYFRVDCVFNGKPLPLVEWTPLIEKVERDASVKVVALGGYFNFYVNGEKVCSIHDETIGQGDITFCCQNYDETDTAVVSLKSFLVNSIGTDVETAYSEETDIKPAQKYNLAKSLFERGKFEPAAVWMENIIRNSERKDLTPSVYTLYGEILLNLSMYDDALRCFDIALENDPENVLLIIEKGNLLYQQGKYLDLDDFLVLNEKHCRNNPYYWNLKGHSAFYLGKNTDACRYYMKASEYDPGNPFNYYNAGKCVEGDDVIEAAEYYKKALLLFYREESFEDVHNILDWFDRSTIEDAIVKSVRGKVLFGENEFKSAEKIFKSLIESEDAESDIFYLFGLILYRKGFIDEGIKSIEKSCEMEPEFSLYFFRLAEFRFANSFDPLSAVETALLLSPEDEWINNLAGLIFLDLGKYCDAEKYFETAYSRNSDVRIILNYSKALVKTGKVEKAVDILGSTEETPEIIVQKGAVLAESGRYEEAYDYLEAAYSANPDNTDIMKYLAEVCYKSEKLSRGEEVLYILEGLSPDSSVYNMIGNIARLKGEFLRAEAAYSKSLEIDFSIVVALNYIEGICEKQDYFDAYSKMTEYIEGKEIPEDINERYSRIREKILKETEMTLSCASCDRAWTLQKNTVMNRQVRIIGEPDSRSPAGRCPSCGKIYCVECALTWLDGQRFTCPDCSENLKLNDDSLRYLVSKFAEEASKTRLS